MVVALLIVLPATVAWPLEEKCLARRYRLTPLPLLPSAINSKDQVAGITDDRRAAVWDAKSGLHRLPLPAGFAHSEALGINIAGDVALTAYTEGSASHEAFVYGKAGLTALHGKSSRAFAINDMDQVAGETVLGERQSRPVVWTASDPGSLGGCCAGTAKGINSLGNAVGDAYDPGGRYSAFLWTPQDGMRLIGPLNRYSSAIAINERGDVLIQAVADVFLYREHTLKKIDLKQRRPTHARALNVCDVIVGSYGPFSDADRAFAWSEDTGLLDLNAIVAAEAGWKLEAALGITDSGTIIGRGSFRGDEDRGFMLSPAVFPE